jgi:uncharacterized membrane protein YedE/YeeE
METAHWPWWLGALALSAIAVGYTRAIGRPLGVSGLVQRAIGPDEAERGTSLLFLVGLVLGGALATVLGMSGTPSTGSGLELQALDASFVAFFGDGAGAAVALAGGGVLVGLGTALAGGCTSGHGLVGCARLQPASLVATAAFFGTALGASLLLRTLFAGGAP